jgi:hypothetical protein
MKEQSEDKYNIREILIRNKGFTPQMLQDLEHQIDLILKVEYINWQTID